MISLLTSETGDHDLTSTRTVFTPAVIDAAAPRLVKAAVSIGTVGKPLSGLAGTFELIIIVGSQVAQPSPQPFAFGTNSQALVSTSSLLIPTNATLELRVKSPNGADLDVTVLVEVYDVGGLTVAQTAKVDLLDTIRDEQNPDWLLDKATDPLAWRVAHTKRVAGTPLFTQLLKDQDGAALNDSTTAVGGMIE